MSHDRRDDQILEILRKSGTATVSELSHLLGISETSVRRDLRRLARGARIVRTYGAAALPGRLASSPSDTRETGEKRRIAAAAAALIHDGQTIAISSGSTTLELARQLAGRRTLSIVTNSLDVVQVLIDLEGIDLIVLGGAVRPRIHSLLGHLTELTIREVRFETFFMGIDAIGRDGSLMNDYMPEFMIDHALCSNATHLVVLAGSKKFDRVAPGHMSSLKAGDTVVTDSRVRTDTVSSLEELGVRVIVA